MKSGNWLIIGLISGLAIYFVIERRNAGPGFRDAPAATEGAFGQLGDGSAGAVSAEMPMPQEPVPQQKKGFVLEKSEDPKINDLAELIWEKKLLTIPDFLDAEMCFLGSSKNGIAMSVILDRREDGKRGTGYSLSMVFGDLPKGVEKKTVDIFTIAGNSANPRFWYDHPLMDAVYVPGLRVSLDKFRAALKDDSWSGDLTPFVGKRGENSAIVTSEDITDALKLIKKSMAAAGITKPEPEPYVQ